jgi:hypothetical protein
MHVEGKGYLAMVYKLLISVFDPFGRSKINIDTTACLPNPSVPDWHLYKTVGKDNAYSKNLDSGQWTVDNGQWTVDDGITVHPPPESCTGIISDLAYGSLL